MPIDRANEVVLTSQALLDELEPRVAEDELMALQFWAKLIRNSRAVIALVEARYGSQAAIVHRVSIEHFAYMYGLAQGEITPEQAVEQLKYEIYEKNAKGLKQSLIKDDKEKREVLTRENREHLSGFLADAGNEAKGTGVNVFNVLSKLDLGFLYDVYRAYSVRASHANVASVTWEPDDAGVSDLLENLSELLTISNAMWKNKIRNDPTI